MSSSWFGKKEPGDVDSSPPPLPGDDPAAESRQLAAGLEQLEKLLGDVTRRIVDHLARCQPQSVAGGGAVAQSIEAKIAALAGQLDRIQGQLESGFEKVIGLARPEEEPLGREEGEKGRGGEGEREGSTSTLESRGLAISPSPSPPLSLAAWEHALVGPDLAGNPSLAFKRQELLKGVLAGDAGAQWLAGQLLVFQSAPAERLPQLLKEIGEAYYRWQPKKRSGTNRFEEALVAWLEKACEAAGISNTIEVVHPGERFDAARHNAASRGVEITEVFGWIVLCDNGKVYTKAAVAVR